MRLTANTRWLLMVVSVVVSSCTEHPRDQQAPGTEGTAQQQMGSGNARDIRKFSQHFLDPKESSPWVFVPQDNIKSVSLTKHPGFATIWHGDKGKDIKGILKDPIRIDDYPLPWEFHLGIAPRQRQGPPYNWALGLNLVLTFSDPSTWPKDRTHLPPDTHSLQLLNVHLYGPQIKSDALNYYAAVMDGGDGVRDGHGNDPYVKPTGPTRRIQEVWLLYGRGDLDPNIMGNWKIPYNWVGYPEVLWADFAGWPNNHTLHFRTKVVSPTLVEVGFSGGLQGEPHLGWRMRTIDVSRFGKITGIWEIGPIIALDRWLANDVPQALGISRTPPFKVSDPSMYYMVDYGVFFGANAENYEHWSDDFDVPGFHAKWFHEAGAISDTYTNPGYLTITLLPQADAVWAMTPTAYGQTQITLTQDFPGYEWEAAWIPPDAETFAWKMDMSGWSVWTESGRSVGYGDPPGGGWRPGVEYDPKAKKHRFVSPYNLKGIDIRQFDLEFDDREVLESILGHKPLYMLVQIPDASHVRVGFKANKGDPWYLSKPFDVTTVWGEKIAKFDPFMGFFGGPSPGNKVWGNFPRYPRFLIDYVHFRKGLSTPK